jgi:hypothetical protein
LEQVLKVFPNLIILNHGRKRGPKMKKREEEKRKRKKKTKVYGRGKKMFFLSFHKPTSILSYNGNSKRKRGKSPFACCLKLC